MRGGSSPLGLPSRTQAAGSIQRIADQPTHLFERESLTLPPRRLERLPAGSSLKCLACNRKERDGFRDGVGPSRFPSPPAAVASLRPSA